MQLDLLWAFMQEDMAVDRYEAEMRQAPNRQKLLKQRAFLLEQQERMKRIETEVANMADRQAALKDEAERLAGLAEAQAKAFEENPPQDVESASKQMAQAQKLIETLTRYEQELSKMRKDAETRDRQQKEIRVRAAKTKEEYDALKKEYDEEFKESSKALKALRDKADAAAKNISPQLVDRYRVIKQHATPPMAQLANNQCGGCYMSLPSAILRDLHDGDKIVECDNCGRILYIPEAER